MTPSSQALPVPRSLTISWPWWLHPFAALLLLPALMAAVAVLLPADAYSVWGTAKFLNADMSLTLAICVVAMLVGILISSGSSVRGGSATIEFSTQQLVWLRRAYRFVFALTLIGYVVWIGNAVSQGIGFSALGSVLDREQGAIHELKSEIRPITGITTLTQFGIIVMALGPVLRRLGISKRWYLLVFLLSLLRFLFYAERLAVIELAVPFLVVIALMADRTSLRGKFARVAPVLSVPVLWGVFAISEYTRSWVYYEKLSSMPFPQWVTLRLLGYYTTSFNNSALFAASIRDTSGYVPYFSVNAFWSAPGVEAILPYPGINGTGPEEWWVGILRSHANAEFNNVGSFLVVAGEWGTIAAVMIWLLAGIAIGTIFARMTHGGLVAMLATATTFVGILELPRFIYLTLGRATPMIVMLIIMALSYPRSAEIKSVGGRDLHEDFGSTRLNA